jgi:hypothetical protein
MTMPDKRERLRLAVREAGRLIGQCGFRSSSNPTAEEILRDHIYTELTEALVLLGLFQKEMDAFLEGLDATLAGTAGTGSTAQLAEPDEIMIVMSTPMLVLMKAVYEWLYHLKQMIAGNATVRGLVNADHWKALQFHCIYRHELVAHRKQTVPRLQPGMFFFDKLSSMVILSIPYHPPANVRGDLDGLFADCAPYLSAEAQRSESYEDKCRAVYQAFAGLPAPLQERVKGFMRRNGALSSEPVAIAEFLRDLIADFYAKLTALP